MKEYEIHVSVAYTTAGGTTEGSYFMAVSYTHLTLPTKA